MTEKYMTASEFLGEFNIFGFHNRLIFDRNAEVDDGESDRLVAIRRKGFDELDTNFINKEELKDKIKLLGHKWELKVINNYNIDTPRDLYIVDFTKEILELLK
jgi:hypothetical protein